jgi:hypothetical protein
MVKYNIGAVVAEFNYDLINNKISKIRRYFWIRKSLYEITCLFVIK